MKKAVILLLLTSYTLLGQITGTVTDEKGERLPYVSVYVKNSTLGTITNEIGVYELSTQKETPTLVFQFLGYKTIEKTVDVKQTPFTLNMQMYPQEVILEEVHLSSKKTIANQIIKKTITSKEKNTEHLNAYTADFYSKGLIRVKNLPKKFLGDEIHLPFPLDSTRSGIIYLSETVSKITSQKNPKQFKERIVASKISGQDNGVSFNQADEVNFNLYDNTITIDGNEVVSPIATYAFEYYKYELSGTYYETDGYLINKIRFSGKRKIDRVFNGYLYIVDGTWAICGAELNINGEQLNSAGINELTIKQNYNYLPEQKAWNITLQTIDFKAGMFKFKINGRFSAAYSNYDFITGFTKKTFTNEVLSFEKEATNKDVTYWEKRRPIPLTLEEKNDYWVKDSIKVVKNSKIYLDSIDKKRNKLTLSNALFGYTYQNTNKNWRFSVKSPLANINFSTVEGWNGSIKTLFVKEQAKQGKTLTTGSEWNYSFSNNNWRGMATASYQWNNFNRPSIIIDGGYITAQFNDTEPITKSYNTIFTLFFEQNFLKIYDKRFASLTYAQDIYNGVRLYSEIGYAKRSPLVNTSDFKLFDYKSREYTSNNPIAPSSNTPSFKTHQVAKGQLSTKIIFKNKYISLPNKKVNLRNDAYPTLLLSYRKIVGIENNFSSDLIKGKIQQSLQTGKFGTFSYVIKGGVFLKEKEIPFMDYLHPTGNRTPFVRSSESRVSDYGILNYYAASTNNKQSEWHFEQNFKGYVLKNIPLINRLNFHTVMGVKALYTTDSKPYNEFSIGIDNIGFGKWRFFRIDYILSVQGRKRNNGFVLWISIL